MGDCRTPRQRLCFREQSECDWQGGVRSTCILRVVLQVNREQVRNPLPVPNPSLISSEIQKPWILGTFLSVWRELL